MLRLEGVSKQFGPRVLLHQADLVVHPGEKVGLIGPNGVGKTTLFRMILGQEDCDAGSVRVTPHRRVGVLRQELALGGRSILEETLGGDPELVALREQRETVRHLLEIDPSGPQAEERTLTLGRLDHRLDELETFSAESRAGTILQGLGFSRPDLDRPLAAFSGGWRMRVALAQLLFSRPDLMLLDEPTNHLDLESVAWLEGYLQRLPATLLVVSHDRSFLDRVAGVIVEMGGGGLTRYSGNFSDYVVKKSADLARLEKEAAKRARKVQDLERFINRFRAKATKARQVQSRIKVLERLEEGPRLPDQERPPSIRLPEPPPCHRQMVLARGLDKAYGDHPVLDGVTLTLTRGEKVGLLGPNGAGKTTLLKLLGGLLPPDQGEIVLGERVKTAYFAQHALEAINPALTVLEAAREGSGGRIDEQSLRGLLGGFLFSGERVLEQTATLSGGERARLALARLFLTGANLLLLDEPTNHLDMNARAVLEEALEAYSGSLFLVSHDRELLAAACTRYLVVEGGAVTPLEGDLDQYLEQVIASRNRGADAGPARDGPRRSERELKRLAAEIRNRLHQRTRPLRQRSGVLEDRIHQLEEAQDGMETQLADPTLYGEEHKDTLKTLLTRQGAVERDLQAALEEWELVSLEIEALEREARTELERLGG
ncbi:MAG: ATP-binding cassette domain-containing protein [Magnetococcales bacterium]|nr:ATP-binding cassette domain-containing protein [Magnetococcales bacterium]